MDTYYWTLSCNWKGCMDMSCLPVRPFLLSFRNNGTCGVVFDCELDFLGKILYGKKWSKWLRKGSFQLLWSVQENFWDQFLLKMFSNKKIVFNIPLSIQTSCLGKFFFSSLANSQPIRLQDSLMEYLLIEWLDFSLFGPPPLCEKGSYDFTTVSMSVCNR